MDHHCAFMIACIGLNNHRHYIQLVFYGIISGYFCFFQSVIWASRHAKQFYENNQFLYFLPRAWFFVTFCITIICYTGVSGFLFGLHFKFALFNTTTIDDKKKTDSDVYSFGFLYNLREFFVTIRGFLFPITCRAKYEGYFYNRVGEDAEINQMDMKASKDTEENLDHDEVIKSIIKETDSNMRCESEYKFNNYKFKAT